MGHLALVTGPTGSALAGGQPADRHRRGLCRDGRAHQAHRRPDLATSRAHAGRRGRRGVTGRGEVLADLVVDLRAGLERQLASTPEGALHWRPAREMNSIGDTVWHVARWLDLCDSWLRNAAPETQHWIADGWAARTGYDPRGVRTDGLGG